MSPDEQANITNFRPELPTRYDVKRELSRGGMGVVFEAFDTVLKLHVAVKVNLRPAMRAAFEREAQLLAHLGHHSLPRCLDLQTEGCVQFLIMDLIEGDDLLVVLSKRPEALGPLPAETVFDWARQILDALDYLHAQKIIHRDLKPSNLKVKDGCIYLLDLGLAYGLSDEMDTLAHGTDDCSGHSPGYSPPEQLCLEEVRPASDLYALAATLYKLLTTHTPPAAKERRRALDLGEPDPLKDIRFYNPDLDEHVIIEINRALSLDVKRRPQSAREMKRMMFPELPAPAPAPPPARAKAWRRPLRLVEAFLLITLPLCALIYAGSGVKTLLSANTPPGPSEPVRVLSPIEQAAEQTAEADRLRLGGHREEALARVGAALDLNPNSPSAWYVRLALWSDSDEVIESAVQPREVLEEAGRIVKALPSPRTRDEYMALAQAHTVLWNLDEAYAAAEKAAGPERDFGQALLLSAWAGFRREVQRAAKEGKGIALAVADQSLADCDAAIEAMPDYPRAYVIRAGIHTQMRSPVRARRDLMRALEIVPRPIYYALLGDVCATFNDPDAARENYQKALARNPKLRRAFLGLAALSEKAGDWRGAVQHYSAANGVLKTADTFKKLGHAYRQLGGLQLPNARDCYEQALKLDRNDAEAQAALDEVMAELDALGVAGQPTPER